MYLFSCHCHYIVLNELVLPLSLSQIQDGKGDVTITNDGATILKQMQVIHPAAQMVRVSALAIPPKWAVQMHAIFTFHLADGIKLPYRSWFQALPKSTRRNPCSIHMLVTVVISHTVVNTFMHWNFFFFG